MGRTLERVGDTWSLMILRDALQGLSKFDQFQKSLGVAPNILTQRLAALVETGFLERRPYQERPVRHEYRADRPGRDFAPVLTALMAFGNRHFAAEGIASQMVERRHWPAGRAGAGGSPLGQADGQPRLRLFGRSGRRPVVLERVAQVARRREADGGLTGLGWTVATSGVRYFQLRRRDAFALGAHRPWPRPPPRPTARTRARKTNPRVSAP